MDDLLDVHVGTRAPTAWDQVEEAQADFPEDSPAREKRPTIASESLPWQELGLRPRWVGEDTSQAVAALDPSRFHGRGAAELERFFRSAAQREELALFVWSFGELQDDEPTFVRSLFDSDASVYFPNVESFWISGSLVRVAHQPVINDELSGADRDLALRLAQRSLDLPWWHLRPTLQQEGAFFGTWTPLLSTQAGETLAGVWTDAEEGDAEPPLGRHYVVPVLPSHRPVLQWLAERAIPELVPSAARRSRRYVAETPELQTSREQELIERLHELTRDYDRERSQLADDLAAERARVAQVRDPLLFGTGRELETAVAAVLTDAGLRVTALDPKLGTTSADLLVEDADRRLLVEVKSSAARPSETLVDAARRHLRTWPQLRGELDIDGIALVINHQHRLPPGERAAVAYERREFVATLDDVPVVTTLQLFNWWRLCRWDEIRAAFGYPVTPVAAVPRPAQAVQARAPRPWWRRRG